MPTGDIFLLCLQWVKREPWLKMSLGRGLVPPALQSRVHVRTEAWLVLGNTTHLPCLSSLPSESVCPSVQACVLTLTHTWLMGQMGIHCVMDFVCVCVCVCVCACAIGV
jgi:hypothetical protein